MAVGAHGLPPLGRLREEPLDAVSAINRAVRHCVPEFLKSIEDIKLGQHEPDSVIEWRKMMAISVIAFVVHGDQTDLDLGDMAISELATATLELCDKPQDQAAINAFVSARRRFQEIQGSLGG